MYYVFVFFFPRERLSEGFFYFFQCKCTFEYLWSLVGAFGSIRISASINHAYYNHRCLGSSPSSWTRRHSLVNAKRSVFEWILSHVSQLHVPSCTRSRHYLWYNKNCFSRNSWQTGAQNEKYEKYHHHQHHHQHQDHHYHHYHHYIVLVCTSINHV